MNKKIIFAILVLRFFFVKRRFPANTSISKMAKLCMSEFRNCSLMIRSCLSTCYLFFPIDAGYQRFKIYIVVKRLFLGSIGISRKRTFD